MSLLIKNHPQQLNLPLAEKEENEQFVNLTKEEHGELIQALATLIRSALNEDLNPVKESD